MLGGALPRARAVGNAQGAPQPGLHRQHADTRVDAPSRTRPSNPCTWRRTRSMASSASASRRRARSTSTSPAPDGRTSPAPDGRTSPRLRTTGLQIHQRLHGGTDLQLLTLAEPDCKNPTRRSHQ